MSFDAARDKIHEILEALDQRMDDSGFLEGDTRAEDELRGVKQEGRSASEDPMQQLEASRVGQLPASEGHASRDSSIEIIEQDDPRALPRPKSHRPSNRPSPTTQTSPFPTSTLPFHLHSRSKLPLSTSLDLRPLLNPLSSRSSSPASPPKLLSTPSSTFLRRTTSNPPPRSTSSLLPAFASRMPYARASWYAEKAKRSERYELLIEARSMVSVW